jgi:tetratricopeptide (TPR) repeat protein
MSQYFQWLFLTAVTGSPVGSAIILLLVWFLTDRFTLGVLPDPLRWVRRLNRELALKRTLLNNPHDGRARLELAQLLIERGAAKTAVEALRPNLEKGDDDVETVFTMGAACVRAGYAEQGEKLLAHAKELDPDFRVGEIELVTGRGRLARADFAGAKEALQRLVRLRSGTVQGRVLLAKSLDGLRDDAAAALMRDDAWKEYVAAPRFQRRKERWWAWRARPSRPLLYFALVLLALGTCVKMAQRARTQAAQQLSPYDDGE